MVQDNNLKKSVTNNINVTGEVVDRTYCIKYLGVWLDDTLSLNTISHKNAKLLCGTFKG